MGTNAVVEVDEGEGEVERRWRWEIVRGGYFLLTLIVCEDTGL